MALTVANGPDVGLATDPDATEEAVEVGEAVGLGLDLGVDTVGTGVGVPGFDSREAERDGTLVWIGTTVGVGDTWVAVGVGAGVKVGDERTREV